MKLTAIVTGSSRGIGRATAIRLARDAMSVVVTGRDRALLASTVEEIQSGGGSAAFLALDLRLPLSPQSLVDFAVATFGGIHILINNAGATKRGDFETLTDEDWADGFALKFYGAVRTTRAAWPHLKKSKGSVVNIAGVGGRTPGAQFSIGGSVNAALLSFTKSLADTGIRDGVQVNAINPGSVRTSRLEGRLKTLASEHSITLEAAAEKLIQESRVTRIGEPDDVASLVSYIVSPAGRLLHGSLIDLDGGETKTI